MKSLVIWDVGGTILDRKLSNIEVVAKGLREIGIDPDAIPAETVLRTMKEFKARENDWRTVTDEMAGYYFLAMILTETCNVTNEQNRKLARYLFNYYDSYYPVLGIMDLLQELAKSGVRQAVVSNWMPSLRLLLKHHNLDIYFEAIISSGELGILKPDQRIFFTALEMLQTKPENTIYIGNDLECDIYPAKSLGMLPIHFDPRRQFATTNLRDVDSLKEELYKILDLPYL